MNTLVNLLLKAFVFMIGVIPVLFLIYIFNLDMKFIAKFIDPFLQKHYDSMEHNQYV